MRYMLPWRRGIGRAIGLALALTLLLPALARAQDAAGAVVRWNRIAIDASGLDHSSVVDGQPNPAFGAQLGPGRSSRAIAIAQIAVFEVVNALSGSPYRSYLRIGPASDASTEIAVATAAHDTLVAMFPAQRDRFRQFLTADLRKQPIRQAAQTLRGMLLGRRVAQAILAQREGDGSDYDEPMMGTEYVPSDQPGFWRQDPISLVPVALGAKWGDVTPFVLQSGDQFRVPPPPPMTSDAYADAFAEVRALGGDGITTPTVRSDDQTQIGIYWAYDGTPSLCAPPRLYNQIALEIAKVKGTRSAVSLARLLALVNVAMADAGIAIWDAKFFYQFWRPVTGIREADPGTGPTGLGDGNDDTFGDVAFSPLGAPASNSSNPNFTPPFPAYPSGHAGFGGALFQVLRRFYGTDAIPFTFVSDEFNGVTRGNDGLVRPLLPRSFTSLSQAEEENGQSRIYLGIHWAFDKTEGIAQGREVADYVFDHAFQRRR